MPECIVSSRQAGIIGRDFLNKYCSQITFDGGLKLKLGSMKIPPRCEMLVKIPVNKGGVGLLPKTVLGNGVYRPDSIVRATNNECVSCILNLNESEIEVTIPTFDLDVIDVSQDQDIIDILELDTGTGRGKLKDHLQLLHKTLRVTHLKKKRRLL